MGPVEMVEKGRLTPVWFFALRDEGGCRKIVNQMVEYAKSGFVARNRPAASGLMAFGILETFYKTMTYLDFDHPRCVLDSSPSRP